MSGQKVYLYKTNIPFSSGVFEQRRVDLAASLRVHVVGHHDKYLVLPSMVGRSKKVITKGVKDKL